MRSRAILSLLLMVVVASCTTAPASPSITPGPSTLPSASPPTSPPVPDARSSSGVTVKGPERLQGLHPLTRPAQPQLAVRYAAALVADQCIDRDLAAPASSDVVLTVLDRSYTLPPSYAPDDLVPASAAGLTGSSGTKLVRSVVIEDLAAMAAAWTAAGLTIAVESAYRSYGAQAATFESWADRLGHAAALLRSARPGHSEHQLGTAIDVTSPGWGGRFGDWARETAEGAWMAEHAWRYGFVMSYPAGSQAQTCFSYEPWHYRWIGREAAAAHRESGLDLRQFLERYVRG